MKVNFANNNSVGGIIANLSDTQIMLMLIESDTALSTFRNRHHEIKDIMKHLYKAQWNTVSNDDNKYAALAFSAHGQSVLQIFM